MKLKLTFQFIFLFFISGTFLLSPLVLRAQTPINCGQTLSGSISVAEEIDSYSFYGSADDVVAIRAMKTSGSLFPYLELYSPGGNLLQGGGPSLGYNTVLTESGTYRIDVKDLDNTDTGNYVLLLEKVNAPCNVVGEVSCGQVVSGSIGTSVDPPPWRVHTFFGTSGDVVTVEVNNSSGGTFSPVMELYDPFGNDLASMTLESTGAYTVLIYDWDNAYAGTYTLKFQNSSNPCPEVTVITPNGGEVIDRASVFAVTWACVSLQEINSQEIRLSTDGGHTFPRIIATGLAGNVRSFDWSVQPDIEDTAKARIRIIATDALGKSTPDDSDANFVILQGGARTYSYDKLNRLTQTIYENGGGIVYTYDQVGNRLDEGIQAPDTTPPTTTASPLGGAYTSGPTVTLNCDDGSGFGCDKIYYTTDGTDPTVLSPVYTEPIYIPVTTTLKFFGTDFAGNSEIIKTQTYTIFP